MTALAMSLRLSCREEEARVYGTKNPDEFDDYVGVCTIRYVSDETAIITGMQGAWSKRHILELLLHILELGHVTVMFQRGPRHRMPWAKQIAQVGFTKNWWVVDPAKVYQEAKKYED